MLKAKDEHICPSFNANNKLYTGLLSVCRINGLPTPRFAVDEQVRSPAKYRNYDLKISTNLSLHGFEN